MSGLVTFRLGLREYATPLTDVREVVRLQGLADLPGMEPPLAGVLDLRGTALPVLDLRAALRPDEDPERRGDVLVLEGGSDDRDADGGSVGVAVDEVRAVIDAGELLPAGAAAADGVLPSYVRQVLRGPLGVVFLVDLVALVDSARGAGVST